MWISYLDSQNYLIVRGGKMQSIEELEREVDMLRATIESQKRTIGHLLKIQRKLEKYDIYIETNFPEHLKYEGVK